MYGIIDIGSNTIRLNIFKAENGKATLLLNRKNTAGLASYVKNGNMSNEGIQRAVEALTDFKLLLGHFGVQKVYAFATAALRNVFNSKEAVNTIVGLTGIPIVVISGKEEAELDFIGATSSADFADGLLIDIGGASTELVIYRGKEIIKAYSMPIGSLNMYNAHVHHLIPNRKERKAIKQNVLAELAKEPAFDSGTYANICGVGGTVRSVGKLNNYLFGLPSNNDEVKAPNVKKIIKLIENDEDDNLLSSETLDILLSIVPDRVRTISPGMIILHTLIKHFKSETIHISKAGVREGYLYTHVLNETPVPSPSPAQAAAGEDETEAELTEKGTDFQ
jgi:exopolyphosphatase/guanosine-5'-triphosphate,3'-diphosphate pyrophosphatase